MTKTKWTPPAVPTLFLKNREIDYRHRAERTRRLRWWVWLLPVAFVLLGTLLGWALA